MSDIAKIKTIGIIGAGVSGLAAARVLSQAGFDCELFEKGGRVGGVWSAGYHTFGLQTPKSLYEIPDYPMPDSYPRVPSGEELQAYFENYAKDFNIFDKIRFNTDVNSLNQQADGKWVVELTDNKTAEKGRKTFDFIVVASGLYFDPHIPEFPGREIFQGDILHTTDYRSPTAVTGKKVAVVGFGKSSLDVAGEVAKFAKQTTLIYRKAHWPIPMDILDILDVRRIYLTRLACGFLPLYQRPEPWEKRLHNSFSWLVSGFWRLTETIIKFQYPLKASNTIAEEPMEIDIFNLDFLPRKEVYQLMRKGGINNERTSIKEFTASGLLLENGKKISCDVVIFGTGYRSDTAFLPESFKQTQEPDGVYLYRHIIHPDISNMAFIGRAATFSNSLTSHLASVWLAHWLTGQFKLPDREAMLEEIESIKQWKRGFMPAITSRSTVIKLHMIHYHDELLKDASINPRRKSNKLAELLLDYRPRDYRDVLEAIGKTEPLS
ncbi:MAG: flavin-containing monooxygenase [Gammaproteobacteria bacterium]